MKTRLRYILHSMKEKAVVIERFNRTLKNKMFKKFTENGNRKWLNILDEIMNEYNNKIHRMINVSPMEASKNPESILSKNMNENDNLEEKQKFNIGDRVRIYKYKYTFTKGFISKWTNEIFIVKSVDKKRKPITYKIIALDGEEILGRFYSNELQKTKF